VTREGDFAGGKVVVEGNPALLDSFSGTVEWAHDAVHVKAKSSLSATPKVDLAACVPLPGGLAAGGSVSFDAKAGAFSKYALGAGYKGDGTVPAVAVFVEDQLSKLRLAASTEVRGIALGLSASYGIQGGAVTAAAGAQWKSGQVTTKARADQTGLVELSTEVPLGRHLESAAHKLILSGCFNAVTGGEAKLGVGLELKP